jgi:NAD(P)-dependent dehydrogenase (short-subunit alcohol dehydrogenase family)
MIEALDRTFVVTGATSGIGAATCAGLARAGGRVVAVGRVQTKVDDLVGRLPAADGVEHRGLVADLSCLEACDLLARTLSTSEAVDVLVNNVGAVFPERTETTERLESTLALNHLGPFVLSVGLLDRLRQAPAPRVISLSSQAHAETLDLDDLQGRARYDGMRAYRQSKLLNILFIRELHRRYGGWLITGCLHPGVVQTGLLADYDRAQGLATAHYETRSRGLLRRVAAGLRQRPPPSTGVSAEEGAETSLHLALTESIAANRGLYWREARIAQPHPIALDCALARRAWAASELIVASTLA